MTNLVTLLHLCDMLMLAIDARKKSETIIIQLILSDTCSRQGMKHLCWPMDSDYQTCAVLYVMEALVPILRVFAKQGGMNREETEANLTVCLLRDSDVVRKYQVSHLYSSLQS
jgi:hypothetical protein